MIILLEGPDKAGKTTLAQNLMTSLVDTGKNVRLLRRGPIQNDVFTEYLRPLDDLIGKSADTIYILDRWHVGELIYGPLLRDESQLTLAQAAYLEMVLQSFGCYFMHYSQRVDRLEQRWDERPDSLIKREWLAIIHSKYYGYTARKIHWTTLIGNWDTYTFDVKYPSPLPGRYIGPIRPVVLLLGDRRNRSDYVWPFVPGRQTSGHWLMNALMAANINHMQVGVVNASELSTENLETLWYTLGRPPVVTLGKQAERAWGMTGLPDPTKLHHPQYMRRFHFTQTQEYGQRIKEIMTNDV